MGIVSYSYMHRSAISHNRKANLRPPMLPSHLVNMARTTAISAMHAASAGSLKSRLARQASPQLHKRTRNLVAHGSMALVVVNRRGSSVSVGCASSPRSGSGGGSCRSPSRSGSVGLVSAA
jgi:primosomal protein N'